MIDYTYRNIQRKQMHIYIIVRASRILQLTANSEIEWDRFGKADSAIVANRNTVHTCIIKLNEVVVIKLMCIVLHIQIVPSTLHLGR